MPTSQPRNPPSPVEDPAELERLQTALASLLRQGQRFTSAAPDPACATDLRGWLDRTQHVARSLADHLKAPARAAVVALVEHPTLDEDACALSALRVNIAGCSPNQLGDEVGLTGNTIRRLEDREASCNPSTAKKLADRFGLGVLELFTLRDDDDLFLATIGELRTALAAGDG
jgi:DNA-binding XRE family transcriptional regulator